MSRRRQGLTGAELVADCQWASGLYDLSIDACNLLWSAYPVGSPIGNAVDRVQHKVSHFAMVRLGDMVEHIPNDQKGHLAGRFTRPERANQFTFEPRGLQGRCHGKLPLATHQQLSRALAQARDYATEAFCRYANAYGQSHQAAKDLKVITASLDALRSKLDDQVGREDLGLGQDALSHLYYPGRPLPALPTAAPD